MNDIIIAKKTNWSATIFLILFESILLTFLLTLVYGLIETPSLLVDLWIILLFMLIILVIILDIILWQLMGKEIIHLSTKMKIKKRGKLFSSVRGIQYNEIDKIIVETDNDTPFILKFYGLKGGILKICFLGTFLRIGQGLSLKDGESIREQIIKML